MSLWKRLFGSASGSHPSDSTPRPSAVTVTQRDPQDLYRMMLNVRYPGTAFPSRKKAAAALAGFDDGTLQELFGSRARRVSFVRDATLAQGRPNEERLAVVLQQLSTGDVPHLSLRDSYGSRYEVAIAECPSRSLQDIVARLKKWARGRTVRVDIPEWYFRDEGEPPATLRLGAGQCEVAEVWRLGTDAFKGCCYDKYTGEDSRAAWL